MRALGQASSALDALAALLPDEAELVENGDTRTVTDQRTATRRPRLGALGGPHTG